MSVHAVLKNEIDFIKRADFDTDHQLIGREYEPLL